jgi:hypothetical protein
MIYSADISTPKDTAKAAAQHTSLKVTKGLVYRVEIQFPRGCAGLLYCAVLDGGHPVWPSSLGEFFRGNANTISFDDSYLKLSEPYEFDVVTYNLDDTYEHSVLIRLGFVSQEIFMARFLPSYSWDYFKKMLEDLAAEQEARRKAAASSPLGWIE